jgi:hypothetical protein
LLKIQSICKVRQFKYFMQDVLRWRPSDVKLAASGWRREVGGRAARQTGGVKLVAQLLAAKIFFNYLNNKTALMKF